MSKKASLSVSMRLGNCNKNEKDNGKTDHRNKKQIDRDIYIEINIQNTECFGKTKSLCNKQHLGSI